MRASAITIIICLILGTVFVGLVTACLIIYLVKRKKIDGNAGEAGPPERILTTGNETVGR